MKKIVFSLIIIVITNFISYSQCTPNPIYQDSTYNIWPDTSTNLSTAYQGIFYDEKLDIKTPATLIEATGGDSSILFIDTTVLGIQVNEFLGSWPVDSMELISVTGMPSGLSFGCDISNCVLPGNTLTCAYVNGTTNDPVGVYPLTILVNVYTHGTIDLGFIQYPYATDLYSELGTYENVPGYKISISSGNPSSFDVFNSYKLSLLQNLPNPFNSSTIIKFHSSELCDLEFFVVNSLGQIVFSQDISASPGLNSFEFNESLPYGIYSYSIKSNSEIVTKRMIIEK